MHLCNIKVIKMKYLKNRRFTVIIFFSILMIVFSFNSCDELIKNRSQKQQEIEAKNEIVNTNKTQAKLLLMLSKDNQDVIKLSKRLQQIITKDSIAQLAKTIENTHIKIAQDFSEVASDKLISIPNYSEVSIIKPLDSSSLNNKIKTLKQLRAKIDNQLFLLEKLSKTTNSEEFKDILSETDTKVNKSLDKTNNILNNLNTNS